jgi:hypothetical protein
MSRFSLAFMLSCFLSATACAQQHSIALGLHTGFIAPYTWDAGINNDARYKARYGIKFAPVGFHYSMDFSGYGFVFSPGLINTGQDFFIINTAGGQVGTREINMQYISVPFAFKWHIIDLSFFRVSGLVSLSGNYLLKGEEMITHTDTKLRFPSSVYPILPPDYVVEYDGVVVPATQQHTIVKQQNFNTLQVFAGIGFRSEWDVSESVRISFDFRVNYGVFEPRTQEYLNRVKANETYYDIHGERRDLFAQLNLGIARYLYYDKSDRDRKKNIKGSSKKYSPKKWDIQPRKRPKPKG